MLSPGTVLDGRYEILGPLGEGGMGAVYRAERPLLGDEVAVKVMRASFDAPSDGRQRFLRESRACAQLRHPNIVSILDFNVDPAGQPYLVMELLSGPSLREELELGGAIAPAAVVSILTPVAAALQLAHDRGITHRDLKPANIVAHRFESGERVYKVIDFGLASMKSAADELQLTEPNMFMGTMAYASPEQLKGEPASPSSDLYTLGTIAYEMLTGRRPFIASDHLTLINETLSAVPVEPGKRRPGVSPEIDAVIMRALSKEPSERFGSVMEFVKALQTAIGEPVAASAPADDTPLSRYELGQVLGSGRLGSKVYRARHRALGIAVAIRILRREDTPNWGPVRARFLMEARTLQVPHPNLLHVRDYGDDERMVYLVTDLIDGPSLKLEVAREGKLPFARVRTLLGQMLDATESLNARGGYIVGVNPEMIRLTREGRRDRLVMSTAGISSVQDVLATMREQELRGEEASEQELPYVAPEVLLGRELGPAADVFTAAVLAYQMACGALPYRARSLPELIGQMLQTRPVAPHELNPDVPPPASAALMRALSSDPAARFADAHEFARELGLNAG